MKRKLSIGVIFGGRSGEHEVSLVSATSVIDALDRKKYDVVPIGITQEGRWISSAVSLQLLKSKKGISNEPERFLIPEPNRGGLASVDGEAVRALDVIFPVVHGTYGEDGTLQGLLELANIPYVGAGVLGSAVGLDKVVQKQLFHEAGLPIAKYISFLGRDLRQAERKVVGRVEKNLRYPLFVKPANTGSSVGISKAHGRSELIVGLRTAAAFDRKIIVEEGIKNVREIECSVLGNDDPIASTPGEIIPSNEFYDYDAKYVDGKSRAVIPAKVSPKVRKQIEELALRAFRALDCAGMARVDFFLTSRQKLILNEINTIPGFTAISMYPKLWEASGISYQALLDRLIALALERHREKSDRITSYRPQKEWYKA